MKCDHKAKIVTDYGFSIHGGVGIGGYCSNCWKTLFYFPDKVKKNETNRI